MISGMKREKSMKQRMRKRVIMDSMLVNIRWIALDIITRHRAYTMKLSRAESCLGRIMTARLRLQKSRSEQKFRLPEW